MTTSISNSIKQVHKRGVISFPKCGRTWIRLFFEYYRRYAKESMRNVMIVFSHDEEYDFQKRVVLVRHPCDVMVSFFLHEKYRRKYPADISYFIRSDKRGILAYNQCYLSWLSRDENQMVVCYEDLFNQQTWRDLLAFYDIPINEKAFERTIEMTQFDTIRENIEQIAKFPSAWRYLAAENGNYDVVHPENEESHKFRRGKIGGYLDYLNQEDIDYILNNFTLGENFSDITDRYIQLSDSLQQSYQHNEQ